MFSKIVDIVTPQLDIKDNSIVAISGFNMATTPEYLILELYRRYNEQGHPKNIFIISDALPAVPGRGLDQIAEGLYEHPNQEFLRGALMPFLGFSPWLQKLVTDNRIECYGWPIGITAYWFREIGSGRPGLFNLDKDITSKMGFKPIIVESLKEMDKRIFNDGLMQKFKM
jgi:propionate CoA-transferase